VTIRHEQIHGTQNSIPLLGKREEEEEGKNKRKGNQNQRHTIKERNKQKETTNPTIPH
jgi:hypothetical protein